MGARGVRVRYRHAPPAAPHDRARGNAEIGYRRLPDQQRRPHRIAAFHYHPIGRGTQADDDIVALFVDLPGSLLPGVNVGHHYHGTRLRAIDAALQHGGVRLRECRGSEEHTSELQSLMRISYAVFCLKKKKTITLTPAHNYYYNTNSSIKTLIQQRYCV